MELKDLSKPLNANQIEFRVQSINKGGYATVLAYKDARADMQRLDDVCGPLGWKREHSRDNRNCLVSVYDASNNQWVGKEDTGTESNAEAQKGLASDSFKRACFNWGIGRELYDYPVTQIKLNGGGPKNGAKVEWYMNGNSPKSGWGLNLKSWVFKTKFHDRKISHLSAVDANGELRFKWENSVFSETLCDRLDEQLKYIREALDPKVLDLQVVCEILRDLTLVEEQKAVWYCLKSDQRAMIKKYRDTDFEK